jgi:hypothetical protein
MQINFKFISGNSDAQIVSHVVKTPGDLLGFAKKLTKLVQDSARVLPDYKKRNVTAISLSKD